MVRLVTHDEVTENNGQGYYLGRIAELEKRIKYLEQKPSDVDLEMRIIEIEERIDALLGPLKFIDPLRTFL